MMGGRLAMWAAVAAAGVAVCFQPIAGFFVNIIHASNNGYLDLPPAIRRVKLYSEGVFYFSFSEDVATAPSWSAAADALLADARSEHPDTIVAWRRFNLLPELIVALVHGAVGSTEDLAVFTARVVSGCTATECLVLFAVVAAAACTAAPRWPSSAVAQVATDVVEAAAPVALCGMFLVISLLGASFTRVNSNITLRENYAAPFLWAAVGAVMARLRARNDAGRRAWTALAAALLTVSLMAWQFMPFLMLIHVVALLGCHAVGVADTAAVADLFAAYAFASVLASALMLGNTMTLLSFATCIVAAWFALRRAVGGGGSEAGFVARAALAAGAAALGVLGKVALQTRLASKPDNHVSNILRAKIEPGFDDFHTLNYLCSSEFNFLSNEDADDLWTTTRVLPLAVATAACGALATVVLLARGHSDQARDHGDIVFLALIATGNGVLAGLISRLLVVAYPGFAALASLTLSPRVVDWLACAVGPCGPASDDSAGRRGDGAGPLHRSSGPADDGKADANGAGDEDKAEKDKASAAGAGAGAGTSAPTAGFRWLYWATRAVHFALSVALLLHVHGTLFAPTYADLAQQLQVTPLEPGGEEAQTIELVDFMAANLSEPGAVVAADPPLSSVVRALTKLPVVVHPHAEDIGARVRYERYWQIYNRRRPEDVHASLAGELGATHVVVTRGPCFVRCAPKRVVADLFAKPGARPICKPFTMVDVANATGSDGRGGEGDPALPQFCFLALKGAKLPGFERLFSNDIFTLLRILPLDGGGNSTVPQQT